MAGKVYFIDVTNRDGVQTSRILLPKLSETMLNIYEMGVYGGIKGFRHVYDNLGIHFKDDNGARKILELAQYANLHTQKPLTDDELRFIATYPDIVQKILTVTI